MPRLPLPVGVLGCGVVATSPLGYLPGMVKLSEKIRVVAVADPVIERAQAVARQFGIAEVYPSLEAMLEGADIDAVVNLTPIPVHGPTTLTALRAGKHVVVEKPIATTLEEANAIIDLARARGLTVVVAPPNMLRPERQEARRLIQEGAIGKVCFARVRSSHGGPAATDWPGDPTWLYQAGAATLFDMGVYGLHDITGLLGPARRVVAFSGITEPVRVVRGGPFKGKTIEVTADDNTLLMLDFGEATFAVVDATFNVNAAKGPQLEIYGRAGTLLLADWMAVREQGVPPLELFRLDVVPGLDGWVTPRLRRLQQQAEERARQYGRGIIVEHLVDCLLEGRQPVLSAEHARHVLEIMLKAMESARCGRALDLATTF